MSKYIYFLIMVLAASLIQVSVINDFRLFLVKPDLPLVTVVIASLYFTRNPAIGFSILAGFLKDIFGVGTFNIILFVLF